MRTWCFAMVAAGCGGSSAGPGDDDVGPDAAAGCEVKAPWASAPPLAIGPTQETAVVAVGDRVVILGGFDAALGITDAVQIFDTVACTYAAGPPLPGAVHHANATVVDGTIFVAGSLQSIGFTAIGDTWSWNPATDADWTVRTPMPAGTQRGAAITGTIGGKIVVAGGFRGSTAVTDVSIYDPALDAWTAEAPLPVARDHACGGVVGDKLYVAGGRQGAIETNADTLFEFTAGAGWLPRAAMPTARGGSACAVVGDRLVVVGGEGNRSVASGVFPEVEAYTPATDTWEALVPMPTPRHGMGAAAIGARMYVPGGATEQGFGAVATHEILTP